MSEKRWKPRNKHLHDVLMSRKSGCFEEKKGRPRQSRAKANQQFRELLVQCE